MKASIIYEEDRIGHYHLKGLGFCPQQRKDYFMKRKLRLPVGIESFEEIRQNQYYYVDKTKLIEQLFDSLGKVSLFTRPRRFGKTLNMSMLKSFFEIGTDPSLFDGLYISGNRMLCEKHMGKYPVIFLSLKGVEGLNFSEAKQRCIRLIKREVE